MTTLREEVYASICASPRSMHDLVRSMALFVPEDHELCHNFRSCLESLRFSPPEQETLYVRRLFDVIADEFPVDGVRLSHPWWVNIIYILTSGGHPDIANLIDTFEDH